MNCTLKHGDTVYYGVVRGTLLGIYSQDQALFMADTARVTFNNAAQLERLLGSPYSNLCLSFIKQHFRAFKDFKVLQQNRFLVVSTDDLKKETVERRTLKEMINKRHLYITMANHYVRGRCSDEDIGRLCQRIENVQLDIEIAETKAHWHTTGLASYE